MGDPDNPYHYDIKLHAVIHIHLQMRLSVHARIQFTTFVSNV